MSMPYLDHSTGKTLVPEQAWVPYMYLPDPSNTFLAPDDAGMGMYATSSAVLMYGR